MKKITALILAAVFCIGFTCSCKNDDKTAKADSKQVSSQSETTAVAQSTQARVIAVGDNLIHSSIYNQALERGYGKKYNFDYAYKNIESTIKLADLAVINQETVIAPDYPPSDYPCFNSPPELGEKMLKLGFRAFNLVNNHVLDKGTGGVDSLLKYWSKKSKKYDMAYFGVYKDKNDLNKIRTIQINGMTFGFVGATQHTNGISLPSNSKIQLIYTSDEKAIKNQIELAKKVSDVVVMNIHWGNEDSHVVTQEQKDLARKMVKWGADVILGTHPHVLQPIEMIKKPDGTKALVIYSLGNFISAQSQAPNMIGGVLDFTVEKNGADGKVRISDIKLMPVINHYENGFKNIRIYPYYMYTPELASNHGVVNYDSRFSYDYINSVINDIIGKKYFTKKLSGNK